MFTFIKKHSVVTSVLGVLVILIAIFIGRKGGTVVADALSLQKKVTLVQASSFRTGGADISADGVIESSAQAELRSQLSAPVTGVYASIGDYVEAGDALVSLQNGDISAQLDQAKASLALAEALYTNAGVSIDSANKTVLDKIRSAYSTVDDAIHTQADQFFSNPRSTTPVLIFTVPDQQLVNNIIFDRVTLEGAMQEWQTTLGTLSVTMTDTDIDAAIARAEKNLELANSFLNEVSQALNVAVVTTPTIGAALPGWKIAISTARGSVSGGIAGLTAAQSALVGARTAQKNPSDSSDRGAVSTGQAQIMAAEATVANLKVQLAKTVIRAPFSGNVGTIPVKVGELVSPGQVVASVVNPRSLIVTAYVSDADFSAVKEGMVATLSDGSTGEVTNIAPSIDTNTKKVQVKIAVTDRKSNTLVIGQTVHVSLVAGETVASSRIYLVPIQDVKIIPGSAYVFVVDEQMRVNKKTVLLGKISGNFVEVKGGLSDDMKIASPVYELEEGDTVVVQ